MPQHTGEAWRSIAKYVLVISVRQLRALDQEIACSDRTIAVMEVQEARRRGGGRLQGIRRAERCRVLGRRRARGQDHVVSNGRPTQGRRDRGVLVDRLVIEGGA